LVCGVADAASYHVRSERHELVVNVTPARERFEFDIAIRDSAGAQLAATQLEGGIGDIVHDTIDAGGERVVINARQRPNEVAAIAEFLQGDVRTEILQSVWSSGAPQPALSMSEPLRVGRDVKAPVAFRKVQPGYPEEARRARVSGIVILEMIIGRDGLLKGDVIVLKPLPNGLTEAAIDAVKQWRFLPGTRNGEPLDVIFNLTVHFKLDQPQEPELP
jgi:TonB family protein